MLNLKKKEEIFDQIIKEKKNRIDRGFVKEARH